MSWLHESCYSWPSSTGQVYTLKDKGSKRTQAAPLSKHVQESHAYGTAIVIVDMATQSSIYKGAQIPGFWTRSLVWVCPSSMVHINSDRLSARGASQRSRPRLEKFSQNPWKSVLPEKAGLGGFLWTRPARAD